VCGRRGWARPPRGWCVVGGRAVATGPIPAGSPAGTGPGAPCRAEPARDGRTGEARGPRRPPPGAGRRAHRGAVAGVPGCDRRAAAVRDRAGPISRRRDVPPGAAGSGAGRVRGVARRRAPLDHPPPMLTLAYPWLLAVLPLPLLV